jgi:hypothetical protein
MVEVDTNIGATAGVSTMQSGGFGSNFVNISSFGPVARLAFNEESTHTLMIALHFRRNILWNDGDINLAMKNRSYRDSFIGFQRLAFVYRINFN